MRLTVSAATLRELFEKTAHQYFEALLPLEDVGRALREKVVAEAETPETLLQAWIQALADLTALHGMVLRGVRILSFKADAGVPCHIHAEIVGELIDRSRHSLKISPQHLNSVRASLQNNPENPQAQIIFAEKL